ncbi:MAG: NAD(P)-dependent oxidoreductase [Promethearchaeota archaeon]
MNGKKIIVCFSSKVSNEVQNHLKESLKTLTNVKLMFPEDTSDDYLKNIVSEVDVLIGWRPSKILLESGKNLKVFINPGTGVNHILDLFIELNKSKKVTLINGHGNSYFVAQHSVALLLTLTNKMIPHHIWMKEGKWRTGDQDAASIPFRYREVGLLGYGAINKKVHQFLAGFDVKFHILRKNWNKQKDKLPTEAKKYGIAELDVFLKEIDVLMIAVPHTSITSHLIKSHELKLLGPKGLIINVARGDIIDQEDLYLALKNKTILGAAIDVWYNYHPKVNKKNLKYPYEFPFHKLENIVLSPHRGYSPFSDLLRWDEVIENINRISQGRSDLINIVNLKEEY